MKLNIGCGRYPIAEHVNLDSQPYDGVDVVTRVPPLPYDDDSIESIYTGHFLEHLPPWDVLPLLEECYRVLVPGGSLAVVVPDAEKARLMLLSYRLTSDAHVAIVHGETHDDMAHRTLWSHNRLRDALRRAGFGIDPYYDWRTDDRVYDRIPQWQSGVRGIKPGGGL